MLRILPLALTLAAGCCPGPHFVDEVYLIRNPDAETQALIDACRDPALPDCVPLCEKVTGNAPVRVTSNPAATFDHCELHNDKDGYVQVHVGYHWQLACY